MDWGFYGRTTELSELAAVLERHRWFFVRITGRRRIGKTTLIRQALQGAPHAPLLYVQIPDSAPAGVLSAVRDSMDTFGIEIDEFARPTSLQELAQTVARIVEAGGIVALDEFQYFSRKHLYEFASHLQAVVDRLAAKSAKITGGLFVLGSIHTDLVALLEDRAAPLFNRTTAAIDLDHLDISSVLAILREHADDSPERLLFLWNLFEGVPKFYRDCYEQDVLNSSREDLAVLHPFCQIPEILRDRASILERSPHLGVDLWRYGHRLDLPRSVLRMDGTRRDPSPPSRALPSTILATSASLDHGQPRSRPAT